MAGARNNNNNNNNNGGEADQTKRMVMVVADATRESSAALQYALSHAMLEKDELILFQVVNPSSWKSTFSTFLKKPTTPAAVAAGPGPGPGPGPSSCSSSSTSSSSNSGGGECSQLGTRGGGGDQEWDHLEGMKLACEIAIPKLRVRIERAATTGSKDDNKAFTILRYCKLFSVDLLIVGQRRSFTMLGSRRNVGAARMAKPTETAEYLIENSKCTCVGVQKKGQNGGYLLNSKTQRNFWLLA